MADTYLELESVLVAAQADAERYRILTTDYATAKGFLFVAETCMEPHMQLMWPDFHATWQEYLAHALDAARKGGGNACIRDAVMTPRPEERAIQGLIALREWLQAEADDSGRARADAIGEHLVAIEEALRGPDVSALVDRFLAWPLPDSVCADMVATKQGAPHRTGTSLLTAIEARQMLEHVLDDASSSHK